MRRLERVTSFCFFCNLPAIHRWYLVFSGVCCVFDHSIVFAICHMWIFLMTGFKSVYGSFVLNIYQECFFFPSFVCPLFSYIPMWLGIHMRIMLIFMKCSFCLTVWWREEWMYAVPSISFQTVFVQTFKIVVDSWTFIMLLIYILWDDWLIFMILASNK